MSCSDGQTGDGHLQHASSCLLTPLRHSIRNQVMRTWTTQMASAAAAMGQPRFQIQTVLGQGQVEVREGDVPVGRDGLMGFGTEGQGYHGYLQQDPPPLPPHMRSDYGGEASRPSVFAGIARAGQALRRRVLAPVLQQVSGYPQAPASLPPLEGNPEGRHEGRGHQQGGLFSPSVAEAICKS